MQATLSLTTLMARRATGVSANLRRFAGVGFGVAFWPARLIPYGVRMEGSITVLRSPAVASPAFAATLSPPASFCHASVTFVFSPTSSPLSLVKKMRHSEGLCLGKKATTDYTDQHGSKT